MPHKPVTAKVRKRLRDLLARARSPNEHEADSAMTMARELMDEYGLTEAEAHDEEHEVPDAAGDDYSEHRQNLALAVAFSRGVTLWRRGNALCFRGIALAARDAVDLFRQLRDAGTAGVERLVADARTLCRGSAAAEAFCRWYFWQSLVESARDRMGLQHLGLDAPPDEEAPKPRVEDRDLTSVEKDVVDAAMTEVGQATSMMLYTTTKQAAEKTAREGGAAPYHPGQRALGEKQRRAASWEDIVGGSD